MDKKTILLFKMPKISKVPVFTFLIIVILIVISYNFKTYDIYKTIGITECNDKCNIEINIPSTKADILNYDLKVEYKNKIYKIKDIKTEDVFIENEIIYKKIIIQTDLLIENNNFIEFKLLYNKQRIINKIIKLNDWKEKYEQITRPRINKYWWWGS